MCGLYGISRLLSWEYEADLTHLYDVGNLNGLTN